MVDEPDFATILHDPERLAVLESSALLNTSPEEAFDQFTRLASAILQTPVALVSLVDQDRQFFKSHVGLQAPWAATQQTPLSHSFCKHVVHTAAPLAVVDAREHPLLRDNLAIAELGAVAYLGIPLTTSQGHTLGSFCVIDSKPRTWSDRETQIVQGLADLVIEKIELRLFAKQLHQNYLELRKLELHRDEMLAMLVHDLRNPMSSFLTALELTQVSGELPPSCRQYVDMAREGGNQLLHMINSILDTSKASTQGLSLERSQIAPQQIIRNVCHQLAPLAEKSGIKLMEDANSSLLCQADTSKLRRVLINLVSNAIQHSSPGGMVIVQALLEAQPEAEPLTKAKAQSGEAQSGKARGEKTQSDTKAHPQTIRFSVIDTGCGIPKQAFERIFEKFGQVRNETTGQSVAEASTGLGLPFSRMVVEAHGGRIWVESELSQGTRFHFTIPCGSELAQNPID